MAKLLIIEDERIQRKNLAGFLRKKKYKVDEADSISKAKELLNNFHYDLIISDMKLEDGSGFDILEMINGNNLDSIFILITAYASFEDSVKIIKMGAYDYIAKPVNLDDLEYKIKRAINLQNIKQENKILKEVIKKGEGELIYKSSIMKNIISTVNKIAKSNAPVLIVGESGTGKELIAKLIHKNSDRKDKIFVAVNSGALNENLLESELFGHEKGAFTGAVGQKPGRFEIADGGTIFLDEIGEISPAMQVKLLRVLQEGEFERVGGTKTIKTDVRIIAATNKNLEQLINENKFREDLYFRLNVLNIYLPPLRERKDDIKILAEYFLSKYSMENNKNISKISREAMKKLENYSYPGNIRELQNIIQRGVILSDSNILEAEDIIILDSGIKNKVSFNKGLEKTIEDIEKQMIKNALEQSGGSVKTASEKLKITERILRYKMKKYEIE